MGCTRWCRWRSSVNHRIEFGALAAFVDRAGMWALTGFQTRCLARFGASVCGATDLVLGCPRASLSPSPTAPPHDGNRASRGQTEQAGSRPMAFFYKGTSGILEKPVEIVVTNLQTLMGVRNTPPRVASRIHGYGHFLHGLAYFVHGSLFAFLRLFYLLFLLFHWRKRERERLKRAGSQSTGFFGA